MPGLSAALGISQRSLSFSQTALNTVSHNIANVNTEGFYRQEVQGANQSIGGFGNGVTLSAITRTLDPLLLDRLTEQRSVAAYDAAVAQFEKNIETVFGSPTSGSSIDKITSDFFSQASALANTPESSAQRLNLIKTATFLSDNLRSINQQLVDVQNLVDDEIDKRLTEVNAAIAKVADLNKEIVSLEGNSLGGRNAADLRDERQRQVDIIAKNFDITTLEDDRGNIRISLETGQLLVSNSHVQLERTSAVAPSNFGGIGIRSVLSNGKPGPNAITINEDRLSNAGEIKALIKVRDDTVPDIQNQVNEFAQTFIDEVNLEHSKGTGTPPLATYTSAHGHKLTTPVGADLTAELGLTAGATLDLSIVNTATGAPLSTTVGAATRVTIGASPFTMNDLATEINTVSAAELGGAITAAVVLDADGNQTLRISTATAGAGIIWGNDADNIMGKIGMNNFFTGEDATNMNIRPDIIAEPLNVATARMRNSDGGLSLNDNRNITDIAAMIDGKFNFDSAGTLSAQENNMQGYFNTIVSNLAVRLQDNTQRQEFSQTIMNDLNDRHTGVTGVNLDEELNKLLIFQRSYQASARMISSINELFDTLFDAVR